jgi:hypothetical protein
MLEVILSTVSAAVLVWLGWWGRGQEEKWAKRVSDMVEHLMRGVTDAGSGTINCECCRPGVARMVGTRARGEVG